MKQLAFKIGDYELPDRPVPEFHFPAGLTTFGNIISPLLPYVFVLAGLILFAAIIWSGFQFLVSAGNPKKTESAKGCLTSAVIGFLLVISSYWLVQLLEVIFNIEVF